MFNNMWRIYVSLQICNKQIIPKGLTESCCYALNGWAFGEVKCACSSPIDHCRCACEADNRGLSNTCKTAYWREAQSLSDKRWLQVNGRHTHHVFATSHTPHETWKQHQLLIRFSNWHPCNLGILPLAVAVWHFLTVTDCSERHEC